MGCVSSRRDINDIHDNVFEVMNVDEQLQHVSPGQIQVTESELIFYQVGKSATRWPLRCLRRYGCSADIFSFESGRRCLTGPGIYGFECGRAEQLFNLVQQNIQLRNLRDDLVTVANEISIPASSTGPPVSLRQPLEQQSYLDSVNINRPVLPRVQNQNNRFSRPGSVTSNGPASPPSASSPTPMTSESTAVSEHNNNKRLQHSYSNTLPLLEADSVASSTVQPYMNLEPTSSPTLSSSSEPYAQLNMDLESECCHVYMNVTPGQTGETSNATVTQEVEQPALLEYDEEKEDPKHCYANLNPGEIETTHVNMRFMHQQCNSSGTVPSLPNVSTALTETRKMNYIVLELNSKNDIKNIGSTALPAEMPKKTAKGYATIDFNKTVALSHSVNPCPDLDNEGSRKTRHNSTIGELAPILARHSTSLSD